MKFQSLIVSSLIGMSLVACSSGGTTIPAPNVTATAIVPATSSSTVSVGTTAGQSVSLPTVAGFTPALSSTPSLSAPLSVPVTASNVTPVGVSTFTADRRVVGDRASQSKPANATTELYLSLTPDVTVTATGSAAFSIGLPTAPNGSKTYYLAFFDGTTWSTALASTPGTLTSSGVNFNLTLANPVTLTAGTHYAFAMYSVPSSATPSPAELAVAITPGPIVTATPSATSTPGSSSSPSVTSSPTVSSSPSSSSSPSVISSPSTINGSFTSGKSFSGVTLNDGARIGGSLPNVNGAQVPFSAFTSVAGLPSGTNTNGLTGSFQGGLIASPTSSVTLPQGAQFSYSIVPSQASLGKVLSVYMLTTANAPVLLASATVSGDSTVNGTATIPSGGYTITPAAAYTIAVYETTR